jgi:hypothetical protein
MGEVYGQNQKRKKGKVRFRKIKKKINEMKKGKERLITYFMRNNNIFIRIAAK